MTRRHIILCYDEINILYVYQQRVKHLYGTCRSTVPVARKKEEAAAQCMQSLHLIIKSGVVRLCIVTDIGIFELNTSI